MTVCKYNLKIEVLNLELSDLTSLLTTLEESAEFDESSGDSISIETVKQE